MIPAPARTPAPYGLLAAAAVLQLPEPHAAMGLQYETVGCTTSRTIGYACEGRDRKTLPPGGPALVGAEPFVVYDSFNCMPRQDARAIAAGRLALGAGAAVEAAFATGVTAPLSLLDATVISAKALDVVNALAMLEAALSDACVTGAIIHAPRGAIASLSAANQVVRDGNVLRNQLGTAYAFGCGYTALGPPTGANEPNGTVGWLYATGPVTIYRSDVVTSPGSGVVFNPATNDALVLSEQVYLLAVECGIWAVPVTDTAFVTRPLILSVQPETVPGGATTPSPNNVTLTVTGRVGANPVVSINGTAATTTVVEPNSVLQVTTNTHPYQPGDVLRVAVTDEHGLISNIVTVPVVAPPVTPAVTAAASDGLNTPSRRSSRKSRAKAN